MGVGQISLSEHFSCPGNAGPGRGGVAPVTVALRQAGAFSTLASLLVCGIVVAADNAPGPDSPAKTTAHGETAYVDQLIAGEPDEDESLDAALLQEQNASGLYSFSALFQYFTLDDSLEDGSDDASSLSLYGARQTRQLGNLYSEVHLSRFDQQGLVFGAIGDDEDPFGSSDVHGAFVVRQTDFALTEKTTMDNTLGVFRPVAGWTRQRSSRLSVLTPELLGASTSLTRGRHTLRLSAGEVGRLRGPLSQAFFSESATATLLGDSWDPGLGWLFAADLWNVSGSPDESENRSGYSLLAARHGAGLNRADRLLQVIGNTDGSLGVSGYLVKRYVRYTHELGAYAIGPDMNWLAREISDDQSGVYWRTDYDKGRTHMNGSLEWLSLNLATGESEKTRAGILANLGWNFRQSYASTLGASGYYRGYHEGSGDDRFFGSSLNMRLFYGYRHNRRYRSRWEASAYVSELSPDSGPVTTQALEYALTFDRSESSQIELELGFQRQHDDYRETWNPTVGLSASAPLSHGGWIDGSVGYSLYDVDRGSGQANWHAQLHVEHPFARRWTAGVQLNYNQTYYDRTQDELAPDPFVLPDSRLASSALLTVRYQTSGGAPISPLGDNGGSGAAGSVLGVVFMDENNDGEQQGDEKTVAGVEVYLDGLYLAKTDATGHFRFPLVATGAHRLYVLEETVPLPWEVLSNDIAIDVSLRKWAKASIALTRIR